MVDNQHKKITGYRDLTELEIALINEGKALAEQVRAYTERVKVEVASDGRWLSIGVTDLQKGFMSVIRSIAQPTTF